MTIEDRQEIVATVTELEKAGGETIGDTSKFIGKLLMQFLCDINRLADAVEGLKIGDGK